MSTVYERLIELWREEKSRAELVGLKTDFINELKEYAINLRRQIRLAAERQSINTQLRERELQAISYVLGDLLSIRMRKVTEMVLRGDRLSGALPMERELYTMMSRVLKNYTRVIDGVVSNFEVPNISLSEVSSPTVLIIERIPLVVDKYGRRFGPYLPGDVAKIPLDLLDAFESKGLVKVIS
ncbi:MAG: hypothetical protein NZ920_00580 [Aigarchaeota archaeon]|nr:hypothetical protein [Aigarchaeota archaeon]MDW8092938.1 hypothetical protein [Nitrososphaerota archaeon]